jgi:hypothetical protein
MVSTGDFDSKLEASISAATSTLDDKDKSARAAAASDREQAVTAAERLAAIKSCAQRFKHNKLESLQRKVLQHIGAAGFAVVGDNVDDDSAVGVTIDTHGDWVIRAAVHYGPNGLTARVDARTPDASCHSASQAFEEATSLPWFEDQMAEAAGKVMATGYLPRGPRVKPR